MQHALCEATLNTLTWQLHNIDTMAAPDFGLQQNHAM
jgi:hypothetical protein